METSIPGFVESEIPDDPSANPVAISIVLLNCGSAVQGLMHVHQALSCSCLNIEWKSTRYQRRLDLGGDGSAHGGDVAGPVPGSPPDGVVNVNDLNAVIVGWGACP